jgi:hypothetical protein
MKKRHIAYLACTAALVGSGLGAAAPSAGPTTYLVRPGDSIQKAVNAAKSGDTVLLTPGTFRESVRITTSGVTLRGMGRTTVIAPAVTQNQSSCAKAGNGICVEGTESRPVEGTTIASLTLAGFAKNALWSSRTDRLTVRDVTAEKNGQWGIAQERSIRGVFRGNTAQNNGDAGLFIGNTVDTEGGATDTQGTVIEGNRLQGNRIGVTVRRLRNLTVSANDINANCTGVFIVGDENAPRAGALTVSDNLIYSNNNYCPKTARLPFLQGSGIVLTGTEDAVLTRNVIADNAGTSPLSGGVVIFKSMVGAKSERNLISGNVLLRNAPADLVDTDTGQDNTFVANACALSKPAGLC